MLLLSLHFSNMIAMLCIFPVASHDAVPSFQWKVFRGTNSTAAGNVVTATEVRLLQTVVWGQMDQAMKALIPEEISIQLVAMRYNVPTSAHFDRASGRV